METTQGVTWQCLAPLLTLGTLRQLRAAGLQGRLRVATGAKSLSPIWLFVTPLTVACQALLSMEFSRQEYRSGLAFPSQGHLPDPGTPASLSSLSLADRFFTTVPPGNFMPFQGGVIMWLCVYEKMWAKYEVKKKRCKIWGEKETIQNL